MKLKFSALLTGLLLAAAFPAYAGDNIATVNGKPIAAARLELAVKAATSDGQTKDSPELRKYLTQRLIDQEIFYQEADKLGLTKRADVQNAIESSRRNIPIQAMQNDFIRKSPITEAEVKTAFDGLVAAQGPTEYLARHIVVGTEDEAKAILAKLKAGGNFDELAKQSKDLENKDDGGKLKWATPYDFRRLPQFAEALKKLQKGQTVDAPVQTAAGFHIIRVDDTRPFQAPAFDDAMKQRLGQQMVEAKVNAYMEGIAKKAIVK